MRGISGKAFGNLLKEARIPIAAIVKKTGFSYATVWRYINETRQTRYSTQDACLAAYFELKGIKPIPLKF